MLWNLPVSTTVSSDLSVHVNLGWVREKDLRGNWSDRAFVGAGFELGVSRSMSAVGQIYREGTLNELEAQLGLRLAGPGTIEVIDLALGRIIRGDDQQWFVMRTERTGFTEQERIHRQHAVCQAAFHHGGGQWLSRRSCDEQRQEMLGGGMRALRVRRDFERLHQSLVISLGDRGAVRGRRNRVAELKT